MSETIPKNSNLSCPACLSTRHKLFFDHINRKKKRRSFYLCQQCQGLFRHPKQFLSPEGEKKRYDSHKNNLNDPQYIDYLQASFNFFRDYIQEGDLGLDFGCGPTKGFEHLSQRDKFHIESYDKYYYPFLAQAWPRKRYDFVIAHEVVEHFTHCLEDFKSLIQVLKPGGWLFIRTQPYPPSIEDFEAWNYKNDPTHVFFYNQKCFEHLAASLSLRLKKVDSNKWIIQNLD